MLHAPRQTGKTTSLRALARQRKSRQRLCAISPARTWRIRLRTRCVRPSAWPAQMTHNHLIVVATGSDLLESKGKRDSISFRMARGSMSRTPARQALTRRVRRLGGLGALPASFAPTALRLHESGGEVCSERRGPHPPRACRRPGH